MDTRILVSYTTRNCSIAEIARAVGMELANCSNIPLVRFAIANL